MKKFLLTLFFILQFSFSYGAPAIREDEWAKLKGFSEGIVTSCKKIVLKNFPHSFNPSIIKTNLGYLLSFRYLPFRTKNPWLSQIGLVQLNENFEIINSPQILHIATQNRKIPSQAEDAKLFSFNGKLFIIYNDNEEKIFPSIKERRDIYIAELEESNGKYKALTPKKLIHQTKYATQLWQKNWVPFVFQNELFLSYSLQPHEIIRPDFCSGSCEPAFETRATLDWDFGILRGSTSPFLDDGEYLAFFHSALLAKSPVTHHHEKWHYFMGAYTFSATPPFSLKSISPYPILGDDFYKSENVEKHVIFPGGCVIDGDKIYLAYGRNDDEIWIATMNKEKLKNSLIPVNG